MHITHKTEPPHDDGENRVDADRARPTFAAWLAETWVDLATMLVIAGVAIGFYISPPLSHRYFLFLDPATGGVLDASIAHPYITPIFSPLAAGLLCVLGPAAVILAMAAWRIRSFWDANNALLGLVYSVLTSTAFQVIVKTVIGGLRPHFLAVCRPEVGDAKAGIGFEGTTFDRSVCTGDRKRINNALISFPSGHATIAFAGFTYLSIYLNAKLKLFSDHQPAYWVLVLAYIPILAATLLSGTLILGQHHHPHDVVAGAIIGAAMAVSSFRAVYAGVWDYRVNHIPLRRRVGFRYCYGADRAIETFGDVVFTRSAGWGKGTGSETIVRGAPGDILFGGGEKGTGLGMGEMGYHRGSGARNGVGGVDRRAGPSETNGRKAEDMV